MTRVALALLLMTCARDAAAAPVGIAGDLYTGHAIVTGSDSRERPNGFARALREVLVKLTADPALADDPRIVPDADSAETLAEDFVYQDRMSDLPTHDEQGTRDRPFELTVHFVPARIDAILSRVGVAAWRAPRPPLALLVTIARGADRFALTADGLPDERPREAAEAAGVLYGMRIVLPPEAQASAFATMPGVVKLSGTLEWSDAAFGWIGRWRMGWQNKDHEWGVAGVSFDEAFRDAVRGAAQIMANSGREHF